MNEDVPPPSYAPDGLYESDVDALIAEYFTADTAERDTVADQAVTHQHIRRVNPRHISTALRVRAVEQLRAGVDGTAA